MQCEKGEGNHENGGFLREKLCFMEIYQKIQSMKIIFVKYQRKLHKLIILVLLP